MSISREARNLYLSILLTKYENVYTILYGYDYQPGWRSHLKGNDMMKTTDNILPAMTDERISELQNFQTKDFTDCPVQTPEQLQEFKPKYPDARLYKPIKKTVQIRLDADVLEWLKQAGPGYQTRVNAILRQAMLQSS